MAGLRERAVGSMTDGVTLSSFLDQVLTFVGARLAEKVPQLIGTFGKPGTNFSVFSVATAIGLAGIYLAVRRRQRGRAVRLRVIARALFPRWLLRSASSRADFGFLLLNVFCTAGLIGWALLSFDTVTIWTRGALAHAVAPLPAGMLNPFAATAVLTLLLFLAYELAYWLDHYLCHTVPFLWEYHRVHHTAEHLSPMTVFRIHPVDSLVFFNIATVITGIVNGTGTYLMGTDDNGFAISGTNVISVLFYYLFVHLQHSELWIGARGFWGRIFISPAHHQIHHSADPAHFGRNLGSVLSIWDWMFGTLMIPPKERPRDFAFGADTPGESPHTITGGLIVPIRRSLGHLGDVLRGRPAAEIR